MNENLYIAHKKTQKNFHTKPCVFTAPIYDTQTHKVPGDENYHSQWISGDGEEEHGKWRTKGDEGAAKKLHDRHDGSFSIPDR